MQRGVAHPLLYPHITSPVFSLWQTFASSHLNHHALYLCSLLLPAPSTFLHGPLAQVAAQTLHTCANLSCRRYLIHHFRRASRARPSRRRCLGATTRQSRSTATRRPQDPRGQEATERDATRTSLSAHPRDTVTRQCVPYALCVYTDAFTDISVQAPSIAPSMAASARDDVVSEVCCLCCSRSAVAEAGYHISVEQLGHRPFVCGWDACVRPTRSRRRVAPPG